MCPKSHVSFHALFARVQLYVRRVKNCPTHLNAEERRPLLVEYVPAVEAPVHPGGEEDGGPGGAPAPVRQVLRVGAGPHDGGLLDVLGPDARAPIAHRQEVLWEARVSLEGVDGAEVRVVHRRYLLRARLGLLVAGEHAPCAKIKLTHGSGRLAFKTASANKKKHELL